MNRRSRIVIGILITFGVLFTVGVSIGLYLMNQYSFLDEAFKSNPFAVLEAASRIVLSQLTSTPTKRFDLEDMDKEYNKVVEFPENRLDLETAEQIIEWSVAHQSQPWVENISEFLVNYHVPVSDLTLHLVFIETKSGENPVMTVTYISSNNTQIIEKGWRGGVTSHSYLGVVTEAFALEILTKFADSEEVVKEIISNYDGAIRLIEE